MRPPLVGHGPLFPLTGSAGLDAGDRGDLVGVVTRSELLDLPPPSDLLKARKRHLDSEHHRENHLRLAGGRWWRGRRGQAPASR